MQRNENDEGAVATEYVFLIALIALAILIGVQAYGQALQAGWVTGANGVQTALE